MIILYLVPIIISFIVLIVGIVSVRHIKKRYLNTIAAKAQNEVAAIESQITRAQSNFNRVLQELEDGQRTKVSELEAAYAKRESELASVYDAHRRACDETEARRKALQQSIDDSKSSIDRELKAFKQMRLTQIEGEISTEADRKREAAIAKDTEFYELQDIERNNYRFETDQIKSELAAYRAKRDALNAEIMRQRELEEKQDFYRVCLSDVAKQDILILESIREKLNCRENLSKLIYDNYVASPAKEMVKRVLNGRDPCGIYKITRIDTGEIYVGKSTSVKDRFISHIKTACGVACIASSTLHTTMARDGIDRFTFELLEEVEKSQLTEREKYWITFYNSDKMGLNQKVG